MRWIVGLVCFVGCAGSEPPVVEPDLAAPPDLTAQADIATPAPDMALVVDLAPPSDQTPGPDLAPPCGWNGSMERCGGGDGVACCDPETQCSKVTKPGFCCQDRFAPCRGSGYCCPDPMGRIMRCMGLDDMGRPHVSGKLGCCIVGVDC